MIRIVFCSVMVCAAPALAGCGTTHERAHDPAEPLLTTTQRRSATASERQSAGTGPAGPAQRTWTLEAEYRCTKPENADRPTFRRPATDPAACHYCTTSRCLPEIVQMHRHEHEAAEAPGGAPRPVPTSTAPAGR